MRAKSQILFALIGLALALAAPARALDWQNNSGSLAKLNDTVSLSAPGTSTWTVTLTGTWVGTVTFQYTIDGTNFYSLQVLPILSSGALGALTATATANGQFQMGNAGFSLVRVKMTSYTSGTATVVMNASMGSYAKPLTGVAATQVEGTTGVGTAAIGNPVQAGGIFNTAPAVITDGQMGALQLDAMQNLLTKINVALPTGSNVIGALLANQSVNVAQLAGTTTDTNSGTKSAGTLRVVLATDQPQLTNKLLVTPDALPANQSVNVAQFGGNNTVTGAGGTGLGIPRVTVSQDTTTVAGSASVPAGTNIMGKVGIDQTTDITTNGVELAPTAAAAAGVPWAASADNVSSYVIKASAGNLYHYRVTNESASQLWIMGFNLTSAPVDGAVSPAFCDIIGGKQTYDSGAWTVPAKFTIGITLVLSSSGCGTKTASANGFFAARSM